MNHKLHVMGRQGRYASAIAFLLAAALVTGLAFAAVTNLATDKTTYVQGDLVTINGIASAGSAVSIQVNGPGGSVVLLRSATADATGAFTSSFRLAGDAAPGTYNVAATQGGTTLTASFSVVRDTIAPTLGLLVTPEREFYFFEESLVIRVTSNEALANPPTVTVTPTGGSPVTVPVTSADSTVWQGTYPLTLEFPGTTIVAVSGTDLSGNAGSAQVSLQIGGANALSVTVETTTPLVPGQSGRIYALVSWSNGSLADITDFPIAHFHTPAGELVNLGAANTVHVGLYNWDFPAQNAPGAYAVHIQPSAGGASVQGLSVITVTSELATSADITNVQNDLVSVRGDIGGLNTNLGAARTDITAIRTDVTAFQADVAALRAQLTPVAQSLGNVTTLIYVVIGLAVVVLALQLATLVRKLD